MPCHSDVENPRSHEEYTNSVSGNLSFFDPSSVCLQALSRNSFPITFATKIMTCEPRRGGRLVLRLASGRLRVMAYVLVLFSHLTRQLQRNRIR
jgi:hypothetical protein